ncbi:MAG: hypothetical protein VX090_16485, partial [Pseudomonadota bacterium]|nr:hypothetical protein [Pseudomonadota bacterium]
TKPTACWTNYSHIRSNRKMSTNTIGGPAIWDNAVALHARHAFPNEKNRLVKRMIIKLDPAQYIIPPVAA